MYTSLFNQRWLLGKKAWKIARRKEKRIHKDASLLHCFFGNNQSIILHNMPTLRFL